MRLRSNFADMFNYIFSKCASICRFDIQLNGGMLSINCQNDCFAYTRPREPILESAVFYFQYAWYGVYKTCAPCERLQRASRYRYLFS